MGFGRKERENAPVSGTTKDYIRGIAGLCEGVIEGLPNGSKDISLNGTPLQNSDDSFNFLNFSWDLRVGTKDQTAFPNGLNETSIDNTINVEVTNSLSATRTVFNADVTALRIRLAIQLDNKGQEDSITFRILVKEGSGGSFIEKAVPTISGRFPTFTTFQYFYQVDETLDEYSVRVEKISDDSVTTDLVRSLQWLTFTEVVQKQIAYIGTALIAYNFNSELFTSDPEVSLFLAGSIFSIPTNSTINTLRTDRGLTFSGGWDGNFFTPTLATTDPAWAVYALFTRSRQDGGLGYSTTQVNKWDLYQCSVYNNVLISNGFGGTERRYSFNGLITQQQVTIETIRGICATFATKPYWDGTQWRFWQQRPTTVLPRILCNADVRDGKFSPSQGEYQAITTACKVWYTDPTNDYEQSPEPVEVAEAITKYGYHQEEFTALGIITRGAAIRAGRRIIYNSLPKYNKQITFECRPHAIFFKPGEVVQIADSARGRQRKAGLISSATSTAITLDAPTSVSGSDAVIVLTLTDESNNIYTLERDISNAAGTHTIINVSQSLSVLPLPHSTWQIVDGSVTLHRYQILDISPSDNPLFFSITAKLYDPDLESKIESGISITEWPAINRPPAVMTPPNNLVVNILSDKVGIESYWEQPTRIGGGLESYTKSYIAEYKIGLNGSWGNRISTVNLYASWNFPTILTTTYYVRVAAISTEGKTSQWVVQSKAYAQISWTGLSEDSWLTVGEDEWFGMGV
jgi:predicted phage tail protein